MLKTHPFDAARYIKTTEDAASLLDDALGSGSAEYVSHALGIILRADIAALGSVSQELLNGSRHDGPTLATLVVVSRALGLTMAVRQMTADEYAGHHVPNSGENVSVLRANS